MDTGGRLRTTTRRPGREGVSRSIASAPPSNRLATPDRSCGRGFVRRGRRQLIRRPRRPCAVLAASGLWACLVSAGRISNTIGGAREEVEDAQVRCVLLLHRGGVVADDRSAGDRTAAVRAAAEAAGGRLEALYWMLGGHDGLVVLEAPDAETAAAVSVTSFSSGALGHLETHQLLDQDQLLTVLGKAREVRGAFRPPGA